MKLRWMLRFFGIFFLTLNAAQASTDGHYCPKGYYAYRADLTQAKPVCLNKTDFKNKKQSIKESGEDFASYQHQSLKFAQSEMEYQAIAKKLNLSVNDTSSVDNGGSGGGDACPQRECKTNYFWNPNACACQCTQLACPAYQKWNPSTCKCEGGNDFGPSSSSGGKICDPLLCPSFQKWNQEACRCESIVNSSSSSSGSASCPSVLARLQCVLSGKNWLDSPLCQCSTTNNGSSGGSSGVIGGIGDCKPNQLQSYTTGSEAGVALCNCKAIDGVPYYVAKATAGTGNYCIKSAAVSSSSSSGSGCSTNVEKIQSCKNSGGTYDEANCICKSGKDVSSSSSGVSSSGGGTSSSGGTCDYRLYCPAGIWDTTLCKCVLGGGSSGGLQCNESDKTICQAQAGTWVDAPSCRCLVRRVSSGGSSTGGTGSSSSSSSGTCEIVEGSGGLCKCTEGQRVFGDTGGKQVCACPGGVLDMSYCRYPNTGSSSSSGNDKVGSSSSSGGNSGGSSSSSSTGSSGSSSGGTIDDGEGVCRNSDGSIINADATINGKHCCKVDEKWDAAQRPPQCAKRCSGPQQSWDYNKCVDWCPYGQVIPPMGVNPNDCSCPSGTHKQATDVNNYHTDRCVDQCNDEAQKWDGQHCVMKCPVPAPWSYTLHSCDCGTGRWMNPSSKGCEVCKVGTPTCGCSAGQRWNKNSGKCEPLTCPFDGIVFGGEAQGDGNYQGKCPFDAPNKYAARVTFYGGQRKDCYTADYLIGEGCTNLPADTGASSSGNCNPPAVWSSIGECKCPGNKIYGLHINTRDGTETRACECGIGTTDRGNNICCMPGAVVKDGKCDDNCPAGQYRNADGNCIAKIGCHITNATVAGFSNGVGSNNQCGVCNYSFSIKTYNDKGVLQSTRAVSATDVVPGGGVTRTACVSKCSGFLGSGTVTTSCTGTWAQSPEIRGCLASGNGFTVEGTCQ